MAYFAPYIDATGIHIPTYSDIRDSLIEDAKTIFGQDIYLGVDSQDYQYISAIANKIYDAMQLNLLVYNNRGPSTAVGSGLDIVVKINGIKRKTSTYSTCVVDITGTANTVITGGVVQDVNGYKWDLPDVVTIPDSGTISETATCETPGNINAAIGDINIIVNPTSGWSSVTNSVVPDMGEPIETDSQLRARQGTSTAQASRTVLEGTKGAIAAVIGVTRFVVYENDTNATDSNGFPAHSITSVVEGGTDADVAQAIFIRKGPGCYTNGDTSVDVNDSYGQPTTIRFYRPVYDDIDVTIGVKGLSGYTTEITTNIKQAIVDYLNSLHIGDDLSISSLWGAALSVMPNAKQPLFSITSLTAGMHGGAQGTTDITIAFNEVTRGSLGNVVVNVT